MIKFFGGKCKDTEECHVNLKKAHADFIAAKAQIEEGVDTMLANLRVNGVALDSLKSKK